MKRLIIISLAVWGYVLWCTPAHSQTIFQPAKPLTAVDRGLTSSEAQPAAGVITQNTTNIQAALTEGTTASGYGSALPVGKFWTNGLTTPAVYGFRLEGGGGAGGWDSAQQGAQTWLLHGDTNQYSDYGEFHVDNNPGGWVWDDLKTPLFTLRATGGRIEGICFSGAPLSQNVDGLDPRADVLLNIPQSPATPQGKHTIEHCMFRSAHVGVLFGDVDDTVVDNGDRTYFQGVNRWDGCSSAVMLKDQQCREIIFDLPLFQSCERMIDVFAGGNVVIQEVTVLGTGGSLFYIRDEANDPNQPILMANAVSVDTASSNPIFPIMLVNTESGSANHFQHFNFGHISFVNQNPTLGLNEDGGPLCVLRGAQKMSIGVIDQGLIQMVQCYEHGSSDNLPQIHVEWYGLAAPEYARDSVADEAVAPLLLCEPAASGSEHGYYLRIDGWGAHQVSAATGVDRQGVFISHLGGLSKEEYSTGETFWRFGGRVDAIGTAVQTGDGQYSWTVPAELNGAVITGVFGVVDKVGTGGGPMEIDVRNQTQSNADVLTANATIDTGDRHTSQAALQYTIDTANDDLATGDVIVVDIDSVHTTPAEGFTFYVRAELP